MLVAKYANLLTDSSKECLVQVGAHGGYEASILENAGFRKII